MKRKTLLTQLAVSSLLLACSACVQQDNGSSQTTTPPNTEPPAQVDPPPSGGDEQTLKQIALEKIVELEQLISQALAQGIDATREESALWFAKEFLVFADWDEANPEAIENFFAAYSPFKAQKSQYAEELPEFERQQVVNILDEALTNLAKVLAGSVQRRAVNKVDWANVEAQHDQFVSNGKPIFLYDYFSKSMGNATSDPRLYNDHLGNVDHLPSINPHWLYKNGSFNTTRTNSMIAHPSSKVGYALLWNSNMPAWMKEQEPEIEKGRSLFTGFDIDNPLMQESWSKIIKKFAQLSEGHKSIEMGVILSNEPHWFSEKGHWTQNYNEMTSISSYTQAKFKAWLRQKYSDDLSALNHNWNSQFSSFDAVTIEIPIDPAKRGEPIWYDWCRFNMDRGIEWFTFLQNELHAENPEADTNIKIMPDLFTEDNRSHGIDLEALTELTTMIGDDAKTRGRDLRWKQPEPWEAHYAYFWEELAVAYDFMESVAPEKIHVNSESHFMSSSWWRDLDTSAAYIRNSYWLATLMGMDANLSWFWARDPDGSPEDRLEGKLDFFDPALGGSYAGSTAMQPQVANAHTQVMMDLNSFSEEIMALRKQRRPIRLFYSETSAINKPNHMSEQFKLYESLFFEGFPLGYATKKIIQKQDNANWDLIVVHKTEYVTDAEFEALQSYLDNGGTLVLDSQLSLAKNEYGQERQTRLVPSQGNLVEMPAGASQASIKAKALELIASEAPGVVLTENNGSSHKGCTWRVVKKPGGGYWMTIVNLGKNSASLNTKMKDGSQAISTDLLTGEVLGSSFELESNGVLLLEVNTGS